MVFVLLIIALPMFKIFPRKLFFFVDEIQELIIKSGVPHYPLGVMLRAAKSMVIMAAASSMSNINVSRLFRMVDATQAVSYSSWKEALAVSQKHLTDAMDQEERNKNCHQPLYRYAEILQACQLSSLMVE